MTNSEAWVRFAAASMACQSNSQHSTGWYADIADEMLEHYKSRFPQPGAPRFGADGAPIAGHRAGRYKALYDPVTDSEQSLQAQGRSHEG